MGGEPLLNFSGFVNLGVVGDDGEVSKERRGVRAIEGQRMVVETVMSDTFLGGVVGAPDDRESPEPEPDAVDSDQSRDPLRHEGFRQKLSNDRRSCGRDRPGLQYGREGHAVTPAQVSGAASNGSIPSGTRPAKAASAVTYSA